jgi:hypothetical protein
MASSPPVRVALLLCFSFRCQPRQYQLASDGNGVEQGRRRERQLQAGVQFCL